MLVENTELDYSEADKAVLDFYLGGACETMECAAKRIWSLPDADLRFSKQVLWENMKRYHRARFIRFFDEIDIEYEKIRVDLIDQEVKDGTKFVWPETHSDKRVLELTKDKAYADQINHLAGERVEYEQSPEMQEKKANVEYLRSKNFDDATIRIIYPESKEVFNVF